ncbi:MAG: hypothetical protein KF773_02285 [Deltaproteobacteria bacterium]|nr:hypothetical protein [Deltaproteobacteria bacterium]
MRVDLLVAAFTSLAAFASFVPHRAEACSISPEPGAHIFGSTGGGSPGRRPWITLWNVADTEAVTLNVVAAGVRCDAGVACKGTAVAVDRSGKYLRPRADLPAGARVQVLVGKRMIADKVIDKGAPAALPAWGGMTFVRFSPRTKSMCAPDGPELELRVAPAKDALERAVGLFYVTKPDVKAPHRGLISIQMLGGGTTDLSLHDEHDHRWMHGKQPAELWVMLADDSGNVGAPIKLL